MTAQNDYLSGTTTSSFIAGSSPGGTRCDSVITFSDTRVENIETFLLELSSFDSVILSDEVAVVTIMDNDGECTQIKFTVDYYYVLSK